MIKKRYQEKLPMILWCLGDVGFSGARCDLKALESDMSWLLKKKKEWGVQVRIVGLGDWLAFPSPSERAALLATKGGHGLYDSTLAILDEAMLERCDNWVKLMEPFSGDFLGTTHGHHVYDFSSESDYRKANSDQYICKKLDCTYYGDIGYIRLDFGSMGHQEFIIHHGYGSGRTHGTAVNKRMRAFEGFPNVDFIIMGHDNTRMVNCVNGIYWEGTSEKRAIGSGAYERAYRLDQPHNGYVEELLLSPSAIGGTMIFFENFNGALRIRSLV